MLNSRFSTATAMLAVLSIVALAWADALAKPRRVPLPDRNPQRALPANASPEVALPERKPGAENSPGVPVEADVALPERVPGREVAPSLVMEPGTAAAEQKPDAGPSPSATPLPDTAAPIRKPELAKAPPPSPHPNLTLPVRKPVSEPETAASAQADPAAPPEKPVSESVAVALPQADPAVPAQEPASEPETAASPQSDPVVPAQEPASEPKTAASPQTDPATPPEKPVSEPETVASPHPDLVPPKRKPESARTAAVSTDADIVLPKRKPEPPLVPVARLSELLKYDLSSSDKRAVKATINAVYKGRLPDARSSLRQIKDKTARKLAQWYYYRRRGNDADPKKISQFSADNPDWPNHKRLRLNAEESLLKRKADADEVKAFFGDAKPVTGPGKAALAGAHFATGDLEKGKLLISEAWRQHDFGSKTEELILDRFGAHLDDKDHKARVDRLLLLDRKSKVKAVLRTAKHLDKMERKKIDARIAVVKRSKAAKKLLAAIPEEATKDDVGFYFSRIQWLRRHKKEEEAWKLLQAAPRDPDALIAINEWWIERRVNCRKALNAGFPEIAYEIAKNHEPLSGNHYYEAEFLAGWIALRFLDKPEVALQHFLALRTAASGPKTTAKAEYWLGRTAAALKKEDEANTHYREAAKLPLTYYGQLAAQTLDPGHATLHLPPAPKPTDEDFERFKSRDALQAIAVLQAVGLENLAPLFFHQLARTIKDPAEGVLLAKLAHHFDQPHASVRLSKIALNRGLPLAELAYPTNMFPDYKQINDPVEDALLYALSRQESEFNPSAKSPVGARGLMQIMPRTARAIARQHKVRYRRSALTADPSYNVMLGVAHLGDLINSYRGSYILTLVAYNAGGGRVRSWTKEFGDPRDPNVDAIDWVERIPFTETRNYVKKILTGLQIFRARLNGSDGALRLWEDLNRGQPRLPAEARASSTAANN